MQNPGLQRFAVGKTPGQQGADDFLNSPEYWDQVTGDPRYNPVVQTEGLTTEPYVTGYQGTDWYSHSPTDVSQEQGEAAVRRVQDQQRAERILPPPPPETFRDYDEPRDSAEAYDQGRNPLSSPASFVSSDDHRALEAAGFQYIRPDNPTMHGSYVRESNSSPGTWHRIVPPSSWEPHWKVQHGTDHLLGMHSEVGNAIETADSHERRMARTPPVAEPDEDFGGIPHDAHSLRLAHENMARQEYPYRITRPEQHQEWENFARNQIHAADREMGREPDVNPHEARRREDNILNLTSHSFPQISPVDTYDAFARDKWSYDPIGYSEREHPFFSKRVNGVRHIIQPTRLGDWTYMSVGGSGPERPVHYMSSEEARAAAERNMRGSIAAYGARKPSAHPDLMSLDQGQAQHNEATSHEPGQHPHSDRPPIRTVRRHRAPRGQVAYAADRSLFGGVQYSRTGPITERPVVTVWANALMGYPPPGVPAIPNPQEMTSAGVTPMLPDVAGDTSVQRGQDYTDAAASPGNPGMRQSYGMQEPIAYVDAGKAPRGVNTQNGQHISSALHNATQNEECDSYGDTEWTPEERDEWEQKTSAVQKEGSGAHYNEGYSMGARHMADRAMGTGDPRDQFVEKYAHKKAMVDFLRSMGAGDYAADSALAHFDIGYDDAEHGEPHYYNPDWDSPNQISRESSWQQKVLDSKSALDKALLSFAHNGIESVANMDASRMVSDYPHGSNPQTLWRPYTTDGMSGIPNQGPQTQTEDVEVGPPLNPTQGEAPPASAENGSRPIMSDGAESYWRKMQNQRKSSALASWKSADSQSPYDEDDRQDEVNRRVGRNVIPTMEAQGWTTVRHTNPSESATWDNTTGRSYDGPDYHFEKLGPAGTKSLMTYGFESVNGNEDDQEPGWHIGSWMNAKKMGLPTGGWDAGPSRFESFVQPYDANHWHATHVLDMGQEARQLVNDAEDYGFYMNRPNESSAAPAYARRDLGLSEVSRDPKHLFPEGINHDMFQRLNAYDPDRGEFLYNIDSDDPYYYLKDMPPSRESGSAQHMIYDKKIPYQEEYDQLEPEEDEEGFLTSLPAWDGRYTHPDRIPCVGCLERGYANSYPVSDPIHHKDSKIPDKHKFRPSVDLPPGERLASFNSDYIDQENPGERRTKEWSDYPMEYRLHHMRQIQTPGEVDIDRSHDLPEDMIAWQYYPHPDLNGPTGRYGDQWPSISEIFPTKANESTGVIQPMIDPGSHRHPLSGDPISLEDAMHWKPTEHEDPFYGRRR